MQRKRFFIVDGFAHIFRAYFGVKHIDNNAVFGVTTMLKKLIADEQPDYLAIAFDTPEPTFRKEVYPEYKANRDTMPEDLRPQIPLIKEVCDALNIPVIEYPGFEADDIMGTLAVKAAAEGFQAVIVSGDKDLLQLVRGDDIVIYDGKKDIFFLEESGVAEYFGVDSSQIVDLLTIWGDSADNIPGVPGVGEKGAKNLLKEYGTIEGIYENLDKIKRKAYREGFEKARDNIELTRNLVTIRCDLDIDFDHDAFLAQGADGEKTKALFTRLNFKTLLKDIPIKLKTCQTEYECYDSEGKLQSLLDEITAKGFAVFDTETTSLDPIEAQLVGVAFATEAGKAGYVPLRHEGQDPNWTEKAESMLRSFFENDAIVKCAHNAKYDLSVLTARGWTVNGIVEDTMLMSYLLSPNDNRHGLDALAENELNYRTIHFEDLCPEPGMTFDKVPLSEACRYASEDADICFQLYNIFKPKMVEEELMNVYETVERPLIPVLMRMELAGISLDVAYLSNMSEQLDTRIKELEQIIYELAGEEFNIKSTKQLGHILFEKLGLPVGRKTSKTGSYSTSQDVLEGLSKKGHELPTQLLEYRMLTKLKSTYVDALPSLVSPKTGRVHSSFNQFVTATGRLSSNNPNLQNIPIRTELGREIRGAFLPREGNILVAADYSQIELRLMAHFSNDKTLVASFKDGEDIHRRTASEIMGTHPDLVSDEMRSAAKSINFGLIYGMGDFRLAQELNITRKKAREYIETYFEKMPGVLTFRDSVIKESKKTGLTRTYAGRKRDIPEINSKNKTLQAQGERLAVNTLIQGSAAEILKLAMIQLDKRLLEENLGAKILLQVHDELVLECPVEHQEQVAQLLKETMENIVNFKVPLTVDAHCAPNWKEAK